MTTESGSVGVHWTHQRFVQNLVNASRSRDFEGAAKEWGLYSLHEAEEWQNCHLCNTRMLTCVTIRNKENGNHVVLGEDCYDKLLQFLKTGKVETALPERRGYVHKLRSYWKAKMKEFKDHTVTGWLRDELVAGRINGKVAGIVYTISHLGFAPTTSDADEVIRHYKATRKFKLLSLLGPDDLRGFRHQGLLPSEITIDEAAHIRQMVQRYRLFAERRRHLASINTLKAEFANTLTQLAAFRKRMETALNRGGKSAKAGLEKVDDYRRQIEELSSTTDSFEELGEVTRKAATLYNECKHRARWYFTDPETILSVKTSYSKNYILIERNGRWQARWRCERYAAGDVVSETGLYSARVIDDSPCTLVRLEQRLPDQNRLVTVEFGTESVHDPEAFVGFIQGKVVLPSKPIREAGKYQVFLTNEEGRYYRAWVISA